jgi:hypothetical protein
MTDMLTQELVNAQLKHTGQLIKSALEHGYGDDGYDYLRAGLNLSAQMVEIKYNDDGEEWQYLLNEGLADYACDGICQELYDLKPTALAYLEEGNS